MNLPNYQHLLAKLYTDEVFRQNFLENPAQLGADFGIEPALAQKLANEHAPAIHLFSQSLIRKRMGIVRQLLPGTFLSLGASIPPKFRLFTQKNSLSQKDRYAQEAVSFGKYLLKQKDLKLNAWQKTIIRFEIRNLRLEKPFFYLQLFAYNVPALIRELHQLDDPTQFHPVRRWSILLHGSLGKKHFYKFHAW